MSKIKVETTSVFRLKLKFRQTSGTTLKYPKKVGIAAVENIIEKFEDGDKKIPTVGLEYVIPKGHRELIVTTSLNQKDEIRNKIIRKYYHEFSEPLRVEVEGEILETEKMVVFNDIDKKSATQNEAKTDAKTNTSKLFEVVFDRDFEKTKICLPLNLCSMTSGSMWQEVQMETLTLKSKQSFLEVSASFWSLLKKKGKF